MVPGFLEARTLSLSLDRVATLGIVAVGLTVVLIAGQLDLSVGTILALSGITTISLQPALGVFGAAVAGLIVGIVAGAVNGLLVVVLKVNSLVANACLDADVSSGMPHAHGLAPSEQEIVRSWGSRSRGRSAAPSACAR